MRVKNILNGRSVVGVHEDDVLGLALQLMLWGSVHHLPVLGQDDKLVGLLDERDILARRLQDGAVAEHVLVRAAMSYVATTVTPEEDVAQAALRLLNSGGACLVVVDQGHVVALLTATDFVQGWAQPELAATQSGIAVRDVMHRHPPAAAADEHLLHALMRMIKRHVRHLPVIAADGLVLGMLSNRDVRRAVGDPTQAMSSECRRVQLQSLRVFDVMSRPAVSVTESAPLTSVVSRFMQRGIGAVPVVDEGGALIGLVSYDDLLGAAALAATSHPGRRPPAAHVALQSHAK